MSELLIHDVKLVEKYKNAIPEMERMLELGGYYYVAGTLCLNIKDPVSGDNFTGIDILPIDDYASDIIRKGQYLASQLFVLHKEGSCFYAQAQDNVKKYELAHGRELEPSGTVETN